MRTIVLFAEASGRCLEHLPLPPAEYDALEAELRARENQMARLGLANPRGGKPMLIMHGPAGMTRLWRLSEAP